MFCLLCDALEIIIKRGFDYGKNEKYASVFSWLGEGFHAAYSIVSSIVGKPALAKTCNNYNECKMKLILEPYPSYVLSIEKSSIKVIVTDWNSYLKKIMVV